MNNIRMCLACKARKEKNELYRIIYDENIGIFLDKTGKINKRAVYICKNNECLDKILKHKNIINFIKPISKGAEIKQVLESFKNVVEKLRGI